MLIFDGHGSFLQNFLATEKRIIGATDGNAAGSYGIALSGPLTVSTGEIQVLVLTNWNGFDGTEYPALKSGDALTHLYTDGAKNIFTMPTGAGTDNSLITWLPEIDKKSGIPMFGASEVKPLLAARDATDEDKINGKKVDGKVLDMGTIMLLRALSKIEVRFDPTAATALEGFSISDVSLSAYNTTGRFIPDVTVNLNWDALNTQVVAPTLPDGVGQSESPLRFFEVGANLWRAYVPEMDLAGSGRPNLTIGIKNAAGVETPFTIALDNPNRSGDLKHLLRNHIYRYTISGVEMGGDLKVNVDVDPWDEGELNPDFGLDDKDAMTDVDPWDESELNPGFGFKEENEGEDDAQ